MFPLYSNRRRALRLGGSNGCAETSSAVIAQLATVAARMLPVLTVWAPEPFRTKDSCQ